MGLACSQIRLLTLTARKADCEYGISIDSLEKMALTREMSELSSEYYSRLKSKQVCYYNNGKYNQITAEYLMGYSNDLTPLLEGKKPLKNDNSMVLADYKGSIILNDAYAQAIIAVCGSSIMNGQGVGGTFSSSHIPAILAEFTNRYSKDDFQKAMNGMTLSSSFDGRVINGSTGDTLASGLEVDTSDSTNSEIQKILNFYLPIFNAAASNGWTTEYNKDMALNTDYVSDAISSGTFQIIGVDNFGGFDYEKNLTYYLMASSIETKTNAESREEITAWYNAEKDRISEKETRVDLHMDELSTELEAIKTEIESIQSLIDDAVQSVYDWGGG